MADLAMLNDDDALRDACVRLWNNMTDKQMYITGGIGSTHLGEAFTFDYDLPNDTVYAETCASIGLIFFARRMLELTPEARYADVMERALYNNVLGSIAQDGKHYFYVNPLEVWPQACSCNPGKHHVKAERQGWFGCACCPPNVARLLTSLNQYIYTVHGDTLHTNLYIGSEWKGTLGGTEVNVTQESNYPWEGKVSLKINPAEAAEFGIALRVLMVQQHGDQRQWRSTGSYRRPGTGLPGDPQSVVCRGFHRGKHSDGSAPCLCPSRAAR